MTTNMREQGAIDIARFTYDFVSGLHAARGIDVTGSTLRLDTVTDEGVDRGAIVDNPASLSAEGIKDRLRGNQRGGTARPSMLIVDATALEVDVLDWSAETASRLAVIVNPARPVLVRVELADAVAFGALAYRVLSSVITIFDPGLFPMGVVARALAHSTGAQRGASKVT